MSRTPSVVIAAAVALLVLGAFLTGRSVGRKAAMASMKPEVRIEYRDSVIEVEKPVPVEHTVYRDREVEVPVYIHTTDTVIRTLYLPREERIYRDSSYMAVVSGVDPSLDYMEIYARAKVVTQTVEKAVKVKPKWSVGIQVGAGIAQPFDGSDPVPAAYAGVGLTRRF